MPFAPASQAGVPTLATLGNLAYFRFPPTARGGRAGPVVVGLPGPAEAEAYHALLLTCTSHAEALAAAGGSRGMRPDKALDLPGATLMLDKRRRFPFLVDIDPPLADLDPAAVLSRLRTALSALGLSEPGAEPVADQPPSPEVPVRLSVLKSNAWKASLFTNLDEALEAVSRVPEDRAVLLTLVTEQPSHRPKSGEFRDGSRMASEELLVAYPGRVRRLGNIGTGFSRIRDEVPDAEGVTVVADLGRLLPDGCPDAVVALPLSLMGFPDTIRERFTRLGAGTMPEVANLPVANFLADGGSTLDVERIRVTVRREALARSIPDARRGVALSVPMPVGAEQPSPTKPAPVTTKAPAPPSTGAPRPDAMVPLRPPRPLPPVPVRLPRIKPWTVLDAVTASIPTLDAEAGSYISRRLCLGKGPVPGAMPDTDRDRRRITEAEVVAACRALPWMPLLGKEIGRLRFEGPYPVDRVLSKPWAAGLGEQGLSFLMTLALPGCHVVEVDRRPCIVPATEREWRDARDEALGALLSPGGPSERMELAETAWYAMRERSAELREAILVNLMPEGPDWRLRMTLHLGGLGKAVAECLRTTRGPTTAEAVRDTLATASGTAFTLPDIHRHLKLAAVSLTDGRYLAREAFPEPTDADALTRAAEDMVRSSRGRLSCADILTGLRFFGEAGADVDPAVLDTLLRESGALVDEGKLSWSFARPLPPPAPPRPLGRIPTMVASILSDGRERTHKEMLSSVSALLGSSPSRKAFAAALRRAAQSRVDKGKGGMVYGRREGES